MTSFERKAPPGSELPVLITPGVAGESLVSAFARLRASIEAHLAAVGGVLLRGFSVPQVADFQAFASAFGHPLLNYEFASTPRSAVSAGVYTSTEYPAHQHIPLHNEQAYTREWPMKIWFHCVTTAPTGGETPIADSRAVYRRMPKDILARRHPLPLDGPGLDSQEFREWALLDMKLVRSAYLHGHIDVPTHVWLAEHSMRDEVLRDWVPHAPVMAQHIVPGANHMNIVRAPGFADAVARTLADLDAA